MFGNNMNYEKNPFITSVDRHFSPDSISFEKSYLRIMVYRLVNCEFIGTKEAKYLRCDNIIDFVLLSVGVSAFQPKQNLFQSPHN